jgi:2-dehydro-3-deoxyphosphogluconate aldolase/(4S)-4-hydroxy-2-oxoglutarate aldolase
MSFTDLLYRERMVAIVRGRDAEAALRTVAVLCEEGVGLVEISLTTSDALSVISRAVALGADSMIGAGTVLTGEQADGVRDAGADFVVTPALAEGSLRAKELGLPVIAGAMTPTEAVRAVQEGADAVKLFPASAGGPDYLKALRDPLPDIPFVPTGGVDATAARAYLDNGAAAVGVGSPVAGTAPDGGDLDGLPTRIRGFLAALAPYRGQR